MAHFVCDIETDMFVEPSFYTNHARGFLRADLIGRTQGSVHMGFRLCDLKPDGNIDTCVHSFEKGLFITEGEIELNRNGELFHLHKHDFALIPIGVPHAIRNTSSAPARFIEKCAPRPKEDDEWQDSFFSKPLNWNLNGEPTLVSEPLQRMVGHFDLSQLPASQRVDNHMWGWSKKLLIDKVLGAHQFDLFIIEFDEGGQTSSHDHNFEEAYFVLDGEVTFTAEGAEYVLKPGTIAWSGVGAPHGFYMNRGTSCRWLEVMSPQPPVQFGNRRMANWDLIRSELAT